VGVDKKALLAHAPLPTEEVAAPELIGLSGVARVRAFNAGAYNAFYAPVWTADEADRKAMAAQCDEARLAAFTLVDGEGRLLFDESDIAAIREWPAAVVGRIAAVARRLNGLGAGAVEHAEKN
jgi:hypothetical protein